ncbi:MAG TPA: protein kinase [Acidobacteriota bacterium]|nr:protein kinase [Acidobacteriota bacterium]
MSLASGSRLASYEILSPLGAGGMGGVYRARDQRLGREVAIKVLPEAFTKDPDRLARFEREARLLASLNHPNIGVIHGLEESDGTRFLVLELVPGETLADIITHPSVGAIQRGRPSAAESPGRPHRAAPTSSAEIASGRQSQLDIEEALKICTQIAEALEAAHEKGVIHRDLKPSNVKVTPEGRVKVLDFGLAKAFAPEESSPNLSMSPTLTMGTMQTGVILGTAAYMSPEQAKGKSLDKRTDIWSFGCVLYECLTGKQTFSGEDVSDTLASILRGEPDWQSLPSATPPNIRHLLQSCLQKDRNERLRDIGDARLEIKQALAQPSAILPHAPAVTPRSRIWQLAPWVIALVAVVAASVLTVFYFRRPANEVYPIRSLILAPEKSVFQFMVGDAGPVVISPDGRHLAFTASREGQTMLWVRPLDSLSAQLLTGTEGATFPFWSPDSRHLAFFAAGKLKKVEASGGPPQTICDAARGRAGTWSRDGVILFAPDVTSGIYRVSASGGVPTAVTQLDASRQISTHRWAVFLPDGRHFLYLAASRGQKELSSIRAASIDDPKEDKLILNAYSNVAYANGHLLFVRDGVLMAQPFDVGSLRTTADAFPIVERVQFNELFIGGIFSVSENGNLVYQSGTAESGMQLLWFDRAGKQIGGIPEKGGYTTPRLSPDGERLATMMIANYDVWLYEFERTIWTRFTFDPALDSNPIWSPDGGQIVFSSNRKGASDLYRKPSHGAGNEELLFESKIQKTPTDWSSDGRFILFTYIVQGQGDLWILPLFGDRKPFPFIQSPFFEFHGQFSPNGKWIAYSSAESGGTQVNVAPFPGPGGKYQVSTSGGSQPRWRRDGKELFYLSADLKMMAAEVSEKDSALQIGRVQPMFQARPVFGPGHAYDVSPDGRRFLVVTVVGEESAAPLTLVVNWTAGLKH